MENEFSVYFFSNASDNIFNNTQSEFTTEFDRTIDFGGFAYECGLKQFRINNIASHDVKIETSDVIYINENDPLTKNIESVRQHVELLLRSSIDVSIYDRAYFEKYSDPNIFYDDISLKKHFSEDESKFTADEKSKMKKVIYTYHIMDFFLPSKLNNQASRQDFLLDYVSPHFQVILHERSKRTALDDGNTKNAKQPKVENDLLSSSESTVNETEEKYSGDTPLHFFVTALKNYPDNLYRVSLSSKGSNYLNTPLRLHQILHLNIKHLLAHSRLTKNRDNVTIEGHSKYFNDNLNFYTSYRAMDKSRQKHLIQVNKLIHKYINRFVDVVKTVREEILQENNQKLENRLGSYLIFYADFLQPSYIAETQARVLYIAPFDRKNTHQIKEIDNVVFKRVEKAQIKQVSLSLKNEFGENFDFVPSFTPTFIHLIFRKIVPQINK